MYRIYRSKNRVLYPCFSTETLVSSLFHKWRKKMFKLFAFGRFEAQVPPACRHRHNQEISIMCITFKGLGEH